MSSDSKSRFGLLDRMKAGRFCLRPTFLVIPLKSLIAALRFQRIESQRGFTLIEIIVALSIVVIGILSILAVANFGQRASADNERKVVALNLAREGIEYVRGIRDSNWATKMSPPATTNANRRWDSFNTNPNEMYDQPQDPYRLFTSSYLESNYVLHPQIASGANTQQSGGNPALAPQTVTATQNVVYQVCPAAADSTASNSFVPAGMYVPDTAANCGGRGQAYYRRINITRGKDLQAASGVSNSYSARIQVYVSWPGKRGGNIMLEQYLTDWKK